ncbi:hypothetical protein EPO15_09635, partial [bacterium]
MADKTTLLKSLKLLHGIPEDQLGTLGEFLVARKFEDGAAVFEEGTKGSSLFFVTDGNVRIAKQLKSSGGGAASNLRATRNSPSVPSWSSGMPWRSLSDLSSVV